MTDLGLRLAGRVLEHPVVVLALLLALAVAAFVRVIYKLPIVNQFARKFVYIARNELATEVGISDVVELIGGPLATATTLALVRSLSKGEELFVWPTFWMTMVIILTAKIFNAVFEGLAKAEVLSGSSAGECGAGIEK